MVILFVHRKAAVSAKSETAFFRPIQKISIEWSGGSAFFSALTSIVLSSRSHTIGRTAPVVPDNTHYENRLHLPVFQMFEIHKASLMKSAAFRMRRNHEQPRPAESCMRPCTRPLASETGRLLHGLRIIASKCSVSARFRHLLYI